MKYVAALIAVSTLCLIGAKPCTADWADKDKYAIDKWTNQCLAKDSSTGGEAACWEEANRKWDHEMVLQENKLMALLKPAEKKDLQASQLQWAKFHAAELKLIDDVYTHTSGSMFAPMQAASRVRVVRERVILLNHYRDLVNGL
jgi:uncharacterized protein YecT (DUF1311 family)